MAQQWVFQRTPTFRKSFDQLTPQQKAKAEQVFAKFTKDPFAKAQKKNRLTALYRETIRGVHVEGDLIVIFAVRGNKIVSLDIGTHDIYQ